MIKRALAALVACLAIAAVAAGCGGGGDSTSSGDSTSGGEGGSAPTKAAFIKEADGVCRKADGKLNEEVTEYAEEHNIPLEKEPTKDQQVELYEAVVLPNIRAQGEEIAALTPPEGEEEAVEEITDGLSEGVEAAEEDPQQLTEGKNPLGDASTKASDFGMKVCGAEG